MCASATGTNPQLKINSRFLPFIDKLLIAGLRNGPAGKREAIIRSCTWSRNGSEGTAGYVFDDCEGVCVSKGFGLQKKQRRYPSGRCQLPVRVGVPGRRKRTTAS